uniref:tRNA-yW synthesizing protein 5 n=1 Tax=Eptatretus burgeri TaxID=7764 RepID=A0A8C4WT87_EPTBU
MKRRRNELRLEEKIQVIRASERGKKSRELGAEFAIGKSQVNNILRRKDEYMHLFYTESPLKCCRKMPKTVNEEVNRLTYEWFLLAKDRHLPLTGTILQEKAREFAAQIGIDTFTASNGWLQSFRKRHQIVGRLFPGRKVAKARSAPAQAPWIRPDVKLEEPWSPGASAVRHQGFPHESVHDDELSCYEKDIEERPVVGVICDVQCVKMTESCKVRVVEPVTRDIFLQDVQPKRQPAVLRGLDLGVCTQCWNVDYLREKVGERPVKVHVAPSPFMDFLHKNFAYRTLPFNELMHRASEEKHADFFFNEDEKYYLRSLGDNPRKDVADLKQQFPELAGDVTIPQLFPDEQFFSSVLRVSSASLHLWTHYDVMDNLLMQVTGYKRVVLFSPEDVEFLYLRGDKSEILDIDFPDLTRFPEFPRATRYECNLQPGDTLYIPGELDECCSHLELVWALHVATSIEQRSSVLAILTDAVTFGVI